MPVRYIASLVEHLQALHDGNPRSTNVPKVQEIARKSEHKFAFSRGAYRYLGAKSSLLKLHPQEFEETVPRRRTPNLPPNIISNDNTITPAGHGYILRTFFDSIHQVYPILDPSLPWLSPDAVIKLDCHPAQASMLQLVYAIAGHCASDQFSTLLPMTSSAHAQALRLIDKATAEQSTLTLQVATLLALYALFDPGNSNISQQIGFAIRLAIDLEGSENDEDSGLLSKLHKILFCLENDVCSILARPTSLPEPACPITFSLAEPIDFLCTLYRIQSRYRRQALSDVLRQAVMDVDDARLHDLHPNILSTLWETLLILKPSASVASRLVSTYSMDGHIPNFLTAHRVHEAANIIIDGLSDAEERLPYDLILAYGKSTSLLARWSWKWEAASILLKDLEDRMRAQSFRHQASTAVPSRPS